MKRVVNSQEVTHLWASQAQDAARNSQGNVYFRGDTIFSYGSHFPMARHVMNSKGVAQAVLFTTRTYGPTTAKHLSWTRRAIPRGTLVIPTHNVMDQPSVAILDEIQGTIDGLCLKAKQARLYTQSYLDEAQTNCGLFTQVAAFLGSRRKPRLSSTEELNTKIKAQREAAKLAAVKAKQREDAIQAGLQDELQAWLDGGSNAQNLYRLNRDYMRVEGDEVVTTRSARVPIEHVRRIAPLIIGLINTGKVYQRNGHTIHLGSYAIESLNKDGLLTVGCHRFAKEEVLRIAAVIA